MKERGILFSGPMVRAILDMRKTQTRRLSEQWSKLKPGDRLWVRETWHRSPHFDCLYRADYDDTSRMGKVRSHGGWRHSIFMPRALSRIDLEVTAEVRVQRLQDISEEDAQAEGASRLNGWSNGDLCLADGACCEDNKRNPAWCAPGYRAWFAGLWNEINRKRAPWASNPWVWAITFKRVRP